MLPFTVSTSCQSHQTETEIFLLFWVAKHGKHRLASSENTWSNMPVQTRTSRKPDHRNSFSKRTSRLAKQATSECLHKWWMETSSNGTPSDQRQSGHANTLHDRHKVKTTLTIWRIYCANILQNPKDQCEHLVTQHITNRRAHVPKNAVTQFTTQQIAESENVTHHGQQDNKSMLGSNISTMLAHPCLNKNKQPKILELWIWNEKIH